MITRTVRAQLLAFALVTALGVSHVAAEYTGLADRLLGRGYTVRAEFADSGGIYTGAEVTYRGVPVGRVGELRLSGSGGVSVELRLKDSPEIPADSLAVVANRSAVGEQYVDLQPRSDDGPYLRDGSTVPRRNTRVPTPATELILSLDRLVQSVDRQDLRITVDELGRAFSGTGPHLTRLVDSGNALVQSASDALPETIALIEDSRKVLKTQTDQESAIKGFSRDLAALTAQLKSSDGDIRALMGNGASAAHEVNELLTANRPHLPVLLGNLISGGQITLARLPGVEQMLVTFPVVVAGSYTVLPGDGTTHFGMVVNADDPPPCRQGYGTQWRDPADTSDRPANTDARCTEPRGSDTSVRGAQNAPRAGAAPGGSGGAGQMGGVGRQPVQIGSTGGAQSTFGKDSWQWLLVGPMA
ncbi:MlaD family protein [Streptomyces sp. HNM0663]|uniref:MlaD family protein n=1 Tax=Streptomyces chengmaiensis TaxID=3040919 RepID=A0ABT6HQA0_9ACTN|nr:MlaD family protein [Streptomyces chengmaiensis]MDH2390896.1 MlaD family protein [Streptomyces chengmaiensis]